MARPPLCTVGMHARRHQLRRRRAPISYCPAAAREGRSNFHHSPTGRQRTSSSANAAFEQAKRQRWRALALWIKAVLEAAASGIITIEDALLPFTVLPNGQTAGQWLAPQIEKVYLTGYMPALLPLPRSQDQGDQP